MRSNMIWIKAAAGTLGRLWIIKGISCDSFGSLALFHPRPAGRGGRHPHDRPRLLGRDPARAEGRVERRLDGQAVGAEPGGAAGGSVAGGAAAGSDLCSAAK